jgi:tRNA (cytidine/uridine-2'-O-)-methyltransferase
MARLWLVRPLGFQIDERTLQRAGLDYWERLDWCVVNDWDELRERSKAGADFDRRCWKFTTRGQLPYTAASFAAGDWLVFGSETAGLPPSLLSPPERTLRIPVSSQVRSLNLSTAVAIAGYELARQTGLFADSGT